MLSTKSSVERDLQETRPTDTTLEERLREILESVRECYNDEVDDSLAQVLALFSQELSIVEKKMQHNICRKLAEIDTEKWQDALHCSCLRYAMEQILSMEPGEIALLSKEGGK
jgi:hypothetical protein